MKGFLAGLSFIAVLMAAGPLFAADGAVEGLGRLAADPNAQNLDHAYTNSPRSSDPEAIPASFSHGGQGGGLFPNLKTLQRRVQEKYGQAILDMTRDLIRFRTVAPKDGTPTTNEPEFVRMRKYLESKAKSLGMEYVTHDRDQIIEISIGDGPETLAFYTHGDVVPEGDLPWQEGLNPWDANIKDGRLYGRGSLDDKGPTASILYAMRAMAENHLIPKGKRIALVMTTQEEVGEWDGVAKFSKEKNYRWNLVADGNYPAMASEKGIIGGFIGYPIGDENENQGPMRHAMRIISLRAGAAENQTAEIAEAGLELRDSGALDYLKNQMAGYLSAHTQARFEISSDGSGRLKLTAHGTAAHGSTPNLGHNATTDLVEFLNSLDLERNSRAKFLRYVHRIFGTVHDGSTVGLDVPGDTFYEPPGSSMLNSVLREEAGELRATFDVRFHHRFDAVKAEEAMQKAVRSQDTDLRAVIDFKLDPFFNDPKSRFIKQLVGIHNDERGTPQWQPVSEGGATQARVLTGEYRATFGPATPEEAVNYHVRNESISLADIQMNTDIYFRTMFEMIR